MYYTLWYLSSYLQVLTLLYFLLTFELLKES